MTATHIWFCKKRTVPLALFANGLRKLYFLRHGLCTALKRDCQCFGRRMKRLQSFWDQKCHMRPRLESSSWTFGLRCRESTWINKLLFARSSWPLHCCPALGRPPCTATSISGTSSCKASCPRDPFAKATYTCRCPQMSAKPLPPCSAYSSLRSLNLQLRKLDTLDCSVPAKLRSSCSCYMFRGLCLRACLHACAAHA